jgi:hypothetical protein
MDNLQSSNITWGGFLHPWLDMFPTFNIICLLLYDYVRS